MTRSLARLGLLIALIQGRPARADVDAPARPWIPPQDWLASCDGSWVYSPPDLDEPERAQGCTFMKFGRTGGVVSFNVTVLEYTSTGKAYLSNGDGFLIESGEWTAMTDGKIEVALHPVAHEKVLGVKESTRTVQLTPNGRHLINESTKIFFEPLSSKYPSSQGRLRASLREWVCGDPKHGHNGAMANKALQQTAGCAGRS